MPLTLVQHRPAWFEQLVMRFAGVPHIVVNSSYAATEATGPLPFLRDIPSSQPCALVGRHTPGSTNNNKNCILDYLHTEGYVSLDESLSPSQKSLSKAYTALIQSQLEPAVVSLRFGDSRAWDQVYRQQYIQASYNGKRGFMPPLGSYFQAWSVRNVALKQLHKLWSVEECMEIAREAYQSLETQLEGNNYLLHTEKPTVVDALLWAHLADALCDVHLVTLLADFPNLVKYFQRVYDQNFRLDTDAEWKIWNQEQNLASPFQQLPIEEAYSNEPSTFHDALQLMQSFSVHTHDLQEVLIVAKEKRLQDSKIRRVPLQQSTLYRWRMGGAIRPSKKEKADASEQETPQQEQFRKAHKQNDELWLSAVLAVTVVAVFFGTTTRSER